MYKIKTDEVFQLGIGLREIRISPRYAEKMDGKFYPYLPFFINDGDKVVLSTSTIFLNKVSQFEEVEKPKATLRKYLKEILGTTNE